MQPVIPTPDTIPVNWWWFQILLLFTFFIHVILMNLIVGGSLLTVWDLIRRKNPTDKSLSLPTLVALTINFGVPPLLFVQVLYGHLFYTSSVLMAVPWILVIPILIFAYYGAHIYSHKLTHAPKTAKASLIVSAVLLLVIAFIYVNNNTLALTPDKWGTYFDTPGGNRLNLTEQTLLPRYLHYIIGAIAVAGLGKSAWAHFKQEGDETAGLKVFAWMTLLQMGIGTWFWLALPGEIWRLFMGGNIAYTILMSVGWILALLILHSAFTKRFWMATITGLITIAVMIVIRDLVRQAYLGEVFAPKDLTVTGEASPLIAFLLVFAVGLTALFYMIRMIMKPKKA